MSDRTGLWAGLAGIVLVLACCGGPFLVGAIGVLSVSALAVWATRIALPAAGLLVVVAGLFFYLRFRRTHADSGCCDERAGKSSRKLQ
jgi:NADH:ubiquinone oxidoreductase subunit 2 (subunit N)